MTRIVCKFEGGHGDGMRTELEDANGPPDTIATRCPDCGSRSSYQLVNVKRTRNSVIARYRVHYPSK